MLNKEQRAITNLGDKIEIARAKMQELWDERGCTDREVLKASIKVDVLLNKYQLLKERALRK